MPLYPKRIQIIPQTISTKLEAWTLNATVLCSLSLSLSLSHFFLFNLISYKHKQLLLIEGAGMGLNQQDQTVSWEISISNADMRV